VFFGWREMKRSRPRSAPKIDRSAAMLEARVRQAMCEVRECCGTTLVARRLMPANLSTGKAYTGHNVGALQWRCAELKSAQPFFATFKQVQALGGRVRKGETGTAIKYFVVVPNADPRLEETRVCWATVFHWSQLEFAADGPAPQLVAALERTQIQAHCPIWLEKMLALYATRAALPAGHAIAYEKSAVSPLTVLATRAVLLNHHQLPAEKVRALITPDLYPYLWPACGIPAADEVLEELRTTHATLDWAGYDAAFPCRLFQSPTEYYMHTFYMLAQALHFAVPLGTEATEHTQERAIHCVVAVIQLMQKRGLALGHFRTPGIAACVHAGFFRPHRNDALYAATERALGRTLLL